MGNLTNLQNASRASSKLLGQPLGFFARIDDLEAAVNMDEGTLYGESNPNATYADFSLGGLTPPPVPVVTPSGTVGSTSYSYVIADISNLGLSPSATGSTSTGNAALTLTNYNSLLFSVTPGHTYNIYRSASSGTPSTTGLIGSFTATGGSFTFLDTGIAATTVDIPTVNTTGSIQLNGADFVATVFPGGVIGLGGQVVLNNASGVTLNPAQFLADLLIRTGGGGALADATPTAAALVAAVGGGIRAGALHKLEYRNEGAGTQTITAGSGVTLRAGNTNTILTIASRIFTILFTNVTAGSEAVTIISGPTSAY